MHQSTPQYNNLRLFVETPLRRNSRILLKRFRPPPAQSPPDTTAQATLPLPALSAGQKNGWAYSLVTWRKGNASYRYHLLKNRWLRYGMFCQGAIFSRSKNGIKFRNFPHQRVSFLPLADNSSLSCGQSWLHSSSSSGTTGAGTVGMASGTSGLHVARRNWHADQGLMARSPYRSATRRMFGPSITRGHASPSVDTGRDRERAVSQTSAVDALVQMGEIWPPLAQL